MADNVIAIERLSCGRPKCGRLAVSLCSDCDRLLCRRCEGTRTCSFGRGHALMAFKPSQLYGRLRPGFTPKRPRQGS